MDYAWLAALDHIEWGGDTVTPRGQPTKELVCHTMIVDMTRPVVTVKERHLGYRFMCAEAAWLLSGDDRVETIAPYSKTIANFSDDGATFFGAYGPKLRAQLDYVVGCLRDDPLSRQAVANIWRESPRKTKDYPCHLSTQFLIRDGRLHQVATMRSSDLFLGIVYDIFNFSMWAAYVAICLGDRNLKLGNIYNTAASRHLYDTNAAAATACLADPAAKFEYAPFRWTEFVDSEDLIDHLWRLARGQVLFREWLKELRA